MNTVVNFFNFVFSFIPYSLIACCPLWDAKQMTKRRLLVFFLAHLTIASSLFLCLALIDISFFNFQFVRLSHGLPLVAFYFLFFSGHFWQNLFLSGMAFLYGVSCLGISNYVGMLFTDRLAPAHPQLVPMVAILLFGIPTLPLLLGQLKKLFRTMGNENARIWKIIWLLPFLFTLLCMCSGNVLFFDSQILMEHFHINFLLSRVAVILAAILVLHILTIGLRQAALQENVRMMELQLELQRQQYHSFQQNLEYIHRAQHDLRHQHAVLRALVEEDDREQLQDYLHQMVDNLPPVQTRWCENYAANASLQHYLRQAQAQGIELDVQLAIPQQLGFLAESDLGILLGNCLENALEACALMQNGHKFIKLRSSLSGRYFALTMDNSFNGNATTQDDGRFFSSKRKGFGIGLQSIQAIAAKYQGKASFEVKDNVFLTNIILCIQ